MITILFRDVVYLEGTSTFAENEMGDTLEIPGENRMVFANKKSVRQNEFYQAQATGLKPELMFEIRTSEYLGESQLSYNEKSYTIIRTYEKNTELIELVCSGLVVSHATT